ncbi:hypothetical protein LWF15_35440 [Kineosporia rhizophila]|uniref:hypothetical protein n=1 Tax=Kineosporia rhizophila TaxID=84633 RepID=UPI000A748C01|nr:hypothetical protein [Kineosporia rhizophila]MCE0540798.1 hypothetical protein [Kineosporia rhizophila]
MTEYSTKSAPTSAGDYRAPRRLSTETKASTKTTELIFYVVAVLAVAITALVVGSSDTANGGQTPDPFGASETLRYITFLTIGYMVARGLAKSGSRDNYDA